MLETSTLYTRESYHGFRAVLLPVVFTLGTTLAVVGLQPKTPSLGPIAVVFPPWWSAARCLAAAATGGAIVNRGVWPFIVIVSADVSDPDVPLRQAGALFILDANTLRGCAAVLEKETP